MPQISRKNGKVIISHEDETREFDTVRDALDWCRRLRERGRDVTLAAEVLERQIRETVMAGAG